MIDLFHTSLWLLLIVLLVLLAVLVVRKVYEVWFLPTWSPKRNLMNELGRVVAPIAEGRPGKVAVFGEIWDAEAAEPLDGEIIEKDTEVQVCGFDPVDHKVLRVTRRLRRTHDDSLDV